MTETPVAALENIVPVPEEVRRRAFECAWDIHDNYDLHPDLRTAAYNRGAAGWDDITWEECRYWFRMHRAVWPRRR